VTRTRGTSREPGSARKPSSTGRPRSPGHPGSPGPPGRPVRPGTVAVDVLTCVGARGRTAGRLRPGPTPVGTERILARGLPRTGLIPWASHSARRGACRAGRRRAVRAVGTRRHPAPVGQPVLPARHGPAVRRTPVHRAPVRGARGHRAAVDRRAVRREAVSGVPGRRREAARRRAHARSARLVETRLGRYFSGAPQQLAVLVVVGTVRPVRAGAVVRPVRAAFTQASSPGQAIGIAAQAGVATFHQVPPGLVTQPRRRTCLTSRV
jgi:hypothetical protein